MNLNIKIDKQRETPEVLITTASMTDEVNQVVDFVNNLDAVASVISGIRDEKIELIDQSKIIRAYTESSKVYAVTDHACYQIRLRLYELEDRLTSNEFVRISNSEIVNLKKVKSLDLNFVGTICMELSNGEVCYVSRRNVSTIKKKLGL